MFKLVTSQFPVQVLLLHKVINANVGLSVTTKKLSGLLNGLIKSKAASWAFPWVTSVLCSKLVTELLHDLIVHVSSSKVAI